MGFLKYKGYTGSVEYRRHQGQASVLFLMFFILHILCKKADGRCKKADG